MPDDLRRRGSSWLFGLAPVWVRSLAVALAGLLLFPEAHRNLFPCLKITGTLLFAIDVPFSPSPVFRHLENSLRRGRQILEAIARSFFQKS